MTLPTLSTTSHRLLLRECEAMARARSDLLAFALFTKFDYEINWHHRHLCQRLNDFASGKIKRLIVLMPPRHGKSELVSRRLPALILGQNPNCSIISASYSASLASQMNRDVQRIMDGPDYRRLFPKTRLSGENIRTIAQGSWLRNSDAFEIVGKKGMYRATGVGGGITGHGFNYGIIDDPIKNQEEADSIVYREKVWDWYCSTFYTRQEKEASILVTVTRWHEDDLAGRLLKQMKEDPAADQWEVISYPAVRETLDNATDLRMLGEALWANKYSEETLAKIKATIGTRTWSALFQQQPSPDGGYIVKREWWKFYDRYPETFDRMIQTWDLTFTDSVTSDYVVGGVWGQCGANLYLLDMVRDRLSFSKTIAAFQNLTLKWPQTQGKYVEKAANGAALIDMLKSKIPGIIAVTPTGSKVARANAASPRIEAGNVFLPTPALASWVHEVIEEWAAFPAGEHDDIVDMCTYGILRLPEDKTTDWLPLSMTGANLWRY